MNKGYGVFFDFEHSKDCNVCGTKLNIEKNYEGYTSWAGAMSNVKHKCSRLMCPHIKKEWHEQAVEIILESEKTSSPSLKKILDKDVKSVVRKGLRTEILQAYENGDAKPEEALQVFDVDVRQEISKS